MSTNYIDPTCPWCDEPVQTGTATIWILGRPFHPQCHHAYQCEIAGDSPADDDICPWCEKTIEHNHDAKYIAGNPFHAHCHDEYEKELADYIDGKMVLLPNKHPLDTPINELETIADRLRRYRRSTSAHTEDIKISWIITDDDERQTSVTIQASPDGDAKHILRILLQHGHAKFFPMQRAISNLTIH